MEKMLLQNGKAFSSLKQMWKSTEKKKLNTYRRKKKLKQIENLEKWEKNPEENFTAEAILH